MYLIKVVLNKIPEKILFTCEIRLNLEKNKIEKNLFWFKLKKIYKSRFWEFNKCFYMFSARILYVISEKHIKNNKCFFCLCFFSLLRKTLHKLPVLTLVIKFLAFF